MDAAAALRGGWGAVESDAESLSDPGRSDSGDELGHGWRWSGDEEGGPAGGRSGDEGASADAHSPFGDWSALAAGRRGTGTSAGTAWPGRRHSDGGQQLQQRPRRPARWRTPLAGGDAQAARTQPQMGPGPTTAAAVAAAAAAAAAARRRLSSDDGAGRLGGRGGMGWGHAAAGCEPGGRRRGGSDRGFGAPRRRRGSDGGAGDVSDGGASCDAAADEPPQPLERFERPADDAADTTAAQAARGRDPQGIPWDRLQFTREQYRQQRLATYRNYTNLIVDEEGSKVRRELSQGYAQPAPGGRAFAFLRNWRGVPSSIVHFQLRNLLWALSPHELLAVNANAVSHFSTVTRTATEVLNLRGLPKGPRLPGIGRVQISTLGVHRELLAAGGFTGELVVARLRGAPGPDGAAADADAEAAAAEEEEGEEEDEGEAARRRHGWRGGGFAGGAACGFGSAGRHVKLVYSGRVTQCENGITNGIEISQSCRLGRAILTANNDNNVRVFDAATLAPRARLQFPWAVNYATLRPEGGAPGGGAAAAVVGDDPVVCLVDLLAGQTVLRLRGHKDYAFAAAWHPRGQLLATGNQDGTTMVWDVRAPGGALAVLPGRLGAIRALRWSGDGGLLVAAEPADYVHVYEMEGGAPRRTQEIDLFGEISGIALPPCGSMLFVGVSDPMYSSVLQFQRRRGAGAGPDDEAGCWAAARGAAPRCAGPFEPAGGGGDAATSDEEGEGGAEAAARAAAAGRQLRARERQQRRRGFDGRLGLVGS
ncbi:hypothetical protein Rsub_05914 [Raphidocelis subcapitata]|uniref:Uncharacterized protein n=1 Tax=Raphidocelis subcapitata TaxID=307507 RepID=A0A2V0P2Q6_9CHLO|nr:hypothetical protein Rsub_05914 [Raphidocelis subcapitata]|eukprot:GBF93182.1 hypothetical protein Rsub_05914 [Raphidocelis subcapitata]